MRTVALVIAHDEGESYSEKLRKAGVDYVVDVEAGREALYDAICRAMVG